MVLMNQIRRGFEGSIVDKMGGFDEFGQFNWPNFAVTSKAWRL